MQSILLLQNMHLIHLRIYMYQMSLMTNIVMTKIGEHTVQTSFLSMV